MRICPVVNCPFSRGTNKTRSPLGRSDRLRKRALGGLSVEYMSTYRLFPFSSFSPSACLVPAFHSCLYFLSLVLSLVVSVSISNPHTPPSSVGTILRLSASYRAFFVGSDGEISHTLLPAARSEPPSLLPLQNSEFLNLSCDTGLILSAIARFPGFLLSTPSLCLLPRNSPSRRSPPTTPRRTCIWSSTTRSTTAPASSMSTRTSSSPKSFLALYARLRRCESAPQDYTPIAQAWLQTGQFLPPLLYYCIRIYRLRGIIQEF